MKKNNDKILKNRKIPRELINEIIEGDAIKVMEKIPSGSLSMTFADPPFNLNKKYDIYNDKKEVKEYLEWSKKWIEEMVRITSPTGSIFVHNIPKWLTYFAEVLNKSGAIFRHWIAWDAMGAPLGNTILPKHYGILWYVKSDNFKFYDIRRPHDRCRTCDNMLRDYGGKKNQMHPFGTLVSDVWRDIHRIRHIKRRDEHPCQLPIPLLERLILMCTNKNDITLDPFMGTGTTAIASKKLGRKYIGIDIDPKYVDMSKKKLKETRQTIINDVYISVYLDKILTIRDKDYEKIENFLKTKKLDVGNGKSKQLTLPYFEG